MQTQVIATRVTFPLSREKPYEAQDPPSTTVAQVLEAALGYFKVAPDGTTSYYLVDRGKRPADSTTLAELAVGDRVDFRLVKELIQG
jgi:hypothetical protein